MFRTTLIAVAALGLAAPAFANPVSVTPGALAGRSPHTAYVAADANPSTCGKVMHTIPAGKPHTYGLNAMSQPCPQPELASIAPATTPVADD